MANVLANVAKFMGRVRNVLVRYGRDPKPSDKVCFGPYLAALHSLAKERHLSTVGLDALITFSELWDTWSKQRVAGEVKKISFSATEVSRMSESIAQGCSWLDRYLE